MARRNTATDEIMSRIRNLDHDESDLMAQRGRLQTKMDVLDAEIVRVGNTRRQYEFALNSLGVDADPTLENKKVAVRNAGPKDPIPVPVKNNVIGQLG
jgi:hypothetical protein